MARKILLADDSVTAQNMGRKILVDAGYDVLTVNNGSAALKRVTEAKPDLIILDVYMPGYSGLEVCQRLKDSPETANIPVLLSVGKLEPFKPQEARRVKANAHIVKPFEASELLSAIARLEDGIVPQAHKPSFCSPLPNAENFGEDSSPTWETKAETGRKGSRSKKKEAEAEEAVPNFRDFRKVKGRAAVEAEAPVAAEMPRDITKEELDALSAVAAKLDGPAASESSVPTQTADFVEEPAKVSGQSTGVKWGRRASDKVQEVEASAATTPPVEIRSAEVTEPAEMPVVALDAVGMEAGKETEISLSPVESSTDVPAVPPPLEASTVQASKVESHVAEVQTSEPLAETPQTVEPPAAEIQPSQEVTAVAAVNTNLLAEEPAPIDQQDEPMFASAVAEANVETPTVKAEEPVVHADTPAQKEEAKEEKSEAIEIESVEAKSIEDTAGEESEVPVVAARAEAVEADAPAPSDEELAEALRLLTPATAYAEATVSSTQSQMNDDRYDAPTGSHWMAEAVGLTPEEAAMSLEEEMFRTFATAPAGESESARDAARESTIAAAVENRLAEVARLTEASSEEAPKAMAAAAAAEASGGGENPAQGSEEIAIASIVDKVLADLRPKIVEEIAKKLGQGH